MRGTPRALQYPGLASSLLLVVLLLSACAGPAAPAPTSPPEASAMPRPTSAPQPSLTLAVAVPSAPATVFAPIELTLSTDARFANPFDPAEADLWVQFSGPGGAQVRVPAFWYQEFDRATLAPVGQPGWRARFTPAAPGEWQAVATLAQPPLESPPARFTVAPDPAARGFVRVDKQNPRYFAFDNGEPYFAIGPNIGWPTSLDATVADYGRWFGRLGDNGGTVARVWMASWSFGIEWSDTGLGDYGKRMKQAWLLDRVFELAGEHGIYIMLTLLNHGAFSASVNPEWDGNPYNQANGGMLSQPAEFASNPEARELFKRRVRYIAARWGASPQLLAWEWWNEVNWTPIADAQLLPWVDEMTAHLRQFDPYDHLVSSSYADGLDRSLWQDAAIDFAQQHDYSGNDPLRLFRSVYDSLSASAPGKPVLMAEHGFSANGADAQLGRELIHFHNGIWAAPFSGFAGSGMAWWWDTYIDPQNLWGEYGRLAEFLRGERLAGLAPAKAGAGRGTNALALQSPTRALVWVRNRGYDANEAQLGYAKALREKRAGPDWKYEPELISGRTLALTGLQDGEYTAFWFSPQTGEWAAPASVSVRGGAAELPIADFTRDLALKLVPAGQPRTP